jgi:SET domain-containing protein
MKLYTFILLLAVILVPGSVAQLAAEPQSKDMPLLKTNKEYDKRTVIKKSLIPTAGNGLFASVKIIKGEVIGELGGRLVTEGDYPHGNHYMAAIPECAWKKAQPYKYIDSKDYGAHVSRINFAPREINGVETHFQNAAIKQICRSPYFTFVALKDIEPGQEIWSSYGPHYEYEKFMKFPEIRDFFCGLLKIDCHKEFVYSP